MIKNLNGFEIEKESGIFHFVFPQPASIKDCYDALVEAANRVVEIAKVEEEKLKKAESEVKAEETVEPEIVNK